MAVDQLILVPGTASTGMVMGQCSFGQTTKKENESDKNVTPIKNFVSLGRVLL